jgi:hypothetical protein
MTNEERMQTPSVTDDSERIDLGSLAPEDLAGSTIVDRHDRSVGEVVDVTTDQAGNVEAIVAEAGGFLGLASHRVSLSATQVGVRRGSDGTAQLIVALTEQELRELPEVAVRPIPSAIGGFRS